MFVPGGILPAALSYGPLVETLGSTVQPVLKDLEVYATDTPPPDYSYEWELDGISGAARDAGLETFHLVGYSGGGGVALAYAAEYPERLRSLALIEPKPWEPAFLREEDRAMALPLDQRIPALIALALRPGVRPPASRAGPPPPWMARRPPGAAALHEAFKSYALDVGRLRQFPNPVYYALGSLSNTVFERVAAALASLLADFCVEVYEGRHHFDPPHRAEPQRFAAALRDLWKRARDWRPARQGSTWTRRRT